MHYLLIGLLSLSLLSCKMSSSSGSAEEQGEGAVSLGLITFKGKRDFTSFEMQVGKRICEALGQKRDYLRNEVIDDDVLRVSMTGEYKLCGGTETFNQVNNSFKVRLDNLIIPQFYSQSNSYYFNDIVMDNDEIFSKFCISTLLDPTTGNFYEDSSIRIGLNFVRNGNQDIVEWIKSLKNNQGEFVITEANRAYINTTTNTPNADHLGFERIRERYEVCDGVENNIEDNMYLKKTITGYEIDVN